MCITCKHFLPDGSSRSKRVNQADFKKVACFGADFFSLEDSRPNVIPQSDVKIIGEQKELSPVERLRAQARLIQSLNRLRPYPRVRGKILRFKTWEDLDEFNRTRAANRT